MLGRHAATVKMSVLVVSRSYNKETYYIGYSLDLGKMAMRGPVLVPQ